MDTNTYNINLPKVVIGEMGVVFQIDARQDRLIQYGSFPPNIIELDKLPRLRDEPVMIYDWEKHNHLEIPLNKALKSDDYELILLSKEMTGLTQTPSDEACERINRESLENGNGFYLANQAVNDRLMGKLPTIEIAGHTFYIDVRLWQLRLKDDFSTAISLDEISPYEHDGKVTFLYHPETKSVFHPDWRATGTPEGILAVQTPSIPHLDPVGLARYLKKEDGHYLNRYAFHAEQKAAVVPLAETNFASLFKANQHERDYPHPKR